MLIFLINILEPEDANLYYYMDRMLFCYPDRWEFFYDSASVGMRTFQGCHELKTWYIDLKAKAEASLSQWLGIRYRYRMLADYLHQENLHRFEPSIKLEKDLALLFMIVPYYHKGNDEFGIGLSKGTDDLNSIEAFFILRSIDNNYSLKDTPDGPDKKVYKTFPFYGTFKCGRRWTNGYFKGYFEKSNTSHLVSRSAPGRCYWLQEQRNFTNLDVRFLNSYGRFEFGGDFHLSEINCKTIDRNIRPTWFGDTLLEIAFQPKIGFVLSSKWKPVFYYYLDNKRADDTVRYRRAGNAQHLDFEFSPTRKILWHFGFQRQWINIMREDLRIEYRFLVGFEYTFSRGMFIIWEGIEADPADVTKINRLHNHTYVGLTMRF
ncbi:MAG: hypothetical protein ABIL05_05610 [candidate division WOR-3 bacterium]